MSIQVTCPGCLTRFQVNDKFAGKKGPCPKCKAEIMIPDKSDEVVIHAPEHSGPKDSQGRSVLKPIEREEVRITRWGLIAVLGAIVCSLAIAIGLRFTGEVSLVLRVLGAILFAPALIFAGYTFARDQELAPYRGRELWIRVGITSLVCAGLWLIYAFIPSYLFDYRQAAEAPYWLAGVTISAMMALGALAALAAFELEFTGGLVISALYFIGTLGLAWLAGIQLAGLELAG
ncbi:hypothetical protein SH139x_004189 [Planctomycetaceae bacterium SH139]